MLLANAVNIALLQVFIYGSLAPQNLCHQQDSLDDLLISGTAADVFRAARISHPPPSILNYSVLMPFRHHHARNTETTLNGSDSTERIHERVLPLVA